MKISIDITNRTENKLHTWGVASQLSSKSMPTLTPRDRNDAAGRVAWYENTDGEGTFAVGLDISSTALEADMAIGADLDSDGSVDILAAPFQDDRVMWYKNSDGNGAFSLGVDLAQDADRAT